MEHKVIFYRSGGGQSDIEDFLNGLCVRRHLSKTDRIHYEKVFTYLEVLERYGTRAGYPFIKHLQNNIWELRPLKYRLLFLEARRDYFVVLNYFVKKQEKHQDMN